MPNWCSNTLQLRHDNPDMLNLAVKACQEGNLLNTFVPMPDALNITSGYVGADNSPEQLALVARQEENIKTYGYKDWYDWRIANWGTKWDLDTAVEDYTVDGERVVTVYFDSAWTPPIEAYRQMEKAGFRICASYREEGMAFQGTYEDGIEYTEDIPEEPDEEDN